jgi:transcriptional regulator with PAS, ATPase and Fis domain
VIALGRAFRRLKQDVPAISKPTHSAPNKEQGGRLEHESLRNAAVPLEFTPRDGSEVLSLEDVERRTILNVLERHGGNRAATAAELGISIRKLYYRLSQYQNRGPGA